MKLFLESKGYVWGGKWVYLIITIKARLQYYVGVMCDKTVDALVCCGAIHL